MSADAEKLFDRAVERVRRKDWPAALDILTDVIRLDPDMVQAWVLRGNVRMAREEFLDAALHYERAININEHVPDAWNNLGTVFANMGMHRTAHDAFRRSLQERIAWEPHAGLGNMYSSISELKRAEEHYREALALDNCADRYFALGCVQLGQGNWAEGFPNYHYRWLDNPRAPLARSVLPQWKGEDLSGKTIILYPDQGFGDEIMTMRFVNWAKPGRVLLQSHTSLQRLAQLSGFQTIPLHGPLPSADYACASMDMPMPLGLTWDQVSCGPYLKADPEKVEDWRRRLPPGFNIGVCWMSGSHFSVALSIQRIKSVRADLLRAFKQPGVNLISLQKPLMERVPDDLELLDWTNELDDFADTAALIEALDLIISVDTAVAHLAGALGKRVWNLVRLSGYWPWLASDVCGSQHSIWYPSMRLYRQIGSTDWTRPVLEAAKDLEAERANIAHTH
jgi:hypothetical protein